MFFLCPPHVVCEAWKFLVLVQSRRIQFWVAQDLELNGVIGFAISALFLGRSIMTLFTLKKNSLAHCAECHFTFDMYTNR